MEELTTATSSDRGAWGRKFTSKVVAGEVGVDDHVTYTTIKVDFD